MKLKCYVCGKAIDPRGSFHLVALSGSQAVDRVFIVHVVNCSARVQEAGLLPVISKS